MTAGLTKAVVRHVRRAEGRHARLDRRLDGTDRARHRLGVGMGWHRDEFDFMGVGFEGRGRRADEAIRLMRALWNG